MKDGRAWQGVTMATAASKQPACHIGYAVKFKAGQLEIQTDGVGVHGGPPASSVGAS